MGLDIWHVTPSHNIEESVVDYFTLEELGNQKYAELNRGFIQIVKDDNEESSLVIYFSELGYQRGGMAIEFKTEFINCKPYFDLQIVERAFQFIKGVDRTHEQQLKEEFQRSFVDNFKEGSSIFFASW